MQRFEQVEPAGAAWRVRWRIDAGAAVFAVTMSYDKVSEHELLRFVAGVSRMSEPKLLLSWDGTILGRVEHPGIAACEMADRSAENLTVVFPSVPEDLSDVFIYDVPEPGGFTAELPGIGAASFRYSAPTHGWLISDASGHYLCKQPYNNHLRFDRDEASAWETFFPLTEAELSMIRHILDSRWVRKDGTSGAAPRRAEWAGMFAFRIGDMLIDLRLQDLRRWTRFGFRAVVDEWKTEQFFLFNPLVYITAFKSDAVLEQMRHCVVSLREFGEFDGPIVVMSDRSEQDIRDVFARAGDACGDIAVIALPAQDFVGYVCSKYSIEGQPKLAGHQPLLYLDPDIVIDAPIEHMLTRAARAGRIAAAAEVWNRTHNHIPIGASLIEMDGVEARFWAGLNGGTMTFPNNAEASVLAIVGAIRRSIAGLGRVFGRDFNRWVDQEAMNYVAVKTGAIDGIALTPFVTQHHPDFPHHGRRTGMVHFWGRSSDHKVAEMAAYIQLLRERRAEFSESHQAELPRIGSGFDRNLPFRSDEKLPERHSDDQAEPRILR